MVLSGIVLHWVGSLDCTSNVLAGVVHRAVSQLLQTVLSMFPIAVPHGTRWSHSAEAGITQTLFRADKQTGQTVFRCETPSMYRVVTLVLFTFRFYIVGLSRAWLLIYLFPFFGLPSC